MVSQYVAIDLHRRRSVIVRQTPDGEVIDTVRIDNDPVALQPAVIATQSRHECRVVEVGVGQISSPLRRLSTQRWRQLVRQRRTGVHAARVVGLC